MQLDTDSFFRRIGVRVRVSEALEFLFEEAAVAADFVASGDVDGCYGVVLRIGEVDVFADAAD
jgi:hypothetical protein